MKEKLVITGGTGTGKTTWLREKYQQLIASGIGSDRILVLVSGRVQKLIWEAELHIEISGPRWITSYVGFMQRELQKYWPLVAAKLPEMKKRLQPFFLTLESSQYLMGSMVERMRNAGAWQDVVSSNERLSLEFIQNLSRAAMAGTPYAEIGDRLYQSWEEREQHNQEHYQMMQQVVTEFRALCLQKGLLDYSLVLELYQQYLLADDFYCETLLKRLDYILIDNLEEAFYRQLEFVHHFVAQVNLFAVFNPQGGYSRFAGAVPEIAGQLVGDWPAKKLTICHTASEQNQNLAQLISRRVLTGEAGKIRHSAHAFLSNDLRSEVLPKVAEKIRDCFNAGVRPEEIAILVPFVDPILELTLNHYLEATGTKVVNLSRQNSLTDNVFLQALLTLACLAHPDWEMLPPLLDLNQTYALVLDLDPVRSALLGEVTIKKKPYVLPDLDEYDLRERVGYAVSERYEHLRQWLLTYQQKKPMEISAFFQLVLTEILAYVPDIEPNLVFCRQLIDSSLHFLAVMAELEGKQLAQSRLYLQFLQSGVKGVENLEVLAQKVAPCAVLLASPYVYLASVKKSRVQIWLDLGNEGWYGSDRQELANVHVLQRSWRLGDVFSAELDESYRRQKLAILCQGLLQKCLGEFVFVSTLYSSQGFEQEGILEELLFTALERRLG